MKLVKEILYEKFSEDSDPIQDLGIGIAEKVKPHSLDVLATGFLDDYKYLEEFMKIPVKDIYYLGRYENTINVDTKLSYLLKHKDTTIIDEMSLNKDSRILIFETYKGRLVLHKHCYSIYAVGDVGVAYFIYFGNVNEKFVEDSDPIRDLGIGMISKIEKFWQEFRRNHSIKPGQLEGNYGYWIIGLKLNKNLHIDTLGSCDIAWSSETFLPEYIKFNEINGFFTCCFSTLATIKNNGPKIVKGDYILYVETTYNDNFTEKDVRDICKVDGKVIIKKQG